MADPLLVPPSISTDACKNSLGAKFKAQSPKPPLCRPLLLCIGQLDKMLDLKELRETLRGGWGTSPWRWLILLDYIPLKRQSCPDSTTSKQYGPSTFKKTEKKSLQQADFDVQLLVMTLYIFWALQNKGMIMNYNNLKILLKRIPKAQVPLIKFQLRTQNTISFLNSPSSTELVMFYWCIISGRRSNLISCHQGLKSCSGSSSKERVFLEGCPDTLSLLYYRPYSSFSQSN